MMKNQDSIGNQLPEYKKCINTEGLRGALCINTFLLACNVAKSNGDTVIYDKLLKSATITDRNGFVSIVSHYVD